jgi:Flp pilus assembly protein TadD
MPVLGNLSTARPERRAVVLKDENDAVRPETGSRPALARFLEIGQHLLEQGSYTDARRALRRRLRLAPGDRRTRYLLGIASLRLGDHEEAQRAFTAVLQRHDGDALAGLARRRLAELPRQLSGS